MRRHFTRGTLILTFAPALLAGLATTSEACLFPGLCGPRCGYRGAYYRAYYPPVYVQPCCPPTQAVYAPVYPSYGPACAPCGTGYSSCGPTGCSTGSCGVNLQSPPAVKKDDGWEPSQAGPTEAPPRTYADEPAAKEPPPKAEEPKVEKKKRPFDPFEIPGDSPKPKPPVPGESPKLPVPGKTEVKKPVTPAPETVIEKKKPAPPTSPVDDAAKSVDDAAKKDAKKSEPKTPEAAKESGTNPQLRVPALDLDEKITWRSTPTRTRLILRASFRSPKIVRRPADLDTDPTPLPRGPKIAKN